MTTPSSATARTYLDFQGLASLRGDAARSPDKAARATAEQFEAYFIQQMMKAMRESVEKSDLVDSGHMDMYQDLMDKEVSMQMVRRGGVGLADMLEKQMLQQQQNLANAQSAAQAAAAGLAPTAPAATFMPLQAPTSALPLKPATPNALPLERTGAYELQRRGGGNR